MRNTIISTEEAKGIERASAWYRLVGFNIGRGLSQQEAQRLATEAIYGAEDGQ